MEPWQTRVVEEKNELDARIVKLVDFMNTDAFCVLPQDERKRMLRQEIFMELYSDVLTDRIAAFNLTTPAG